MTPHLPIQAIIFGGAFFIGLMLVLASGLPRPQSEPSPWDSKIPFVYNLSDDCKVMERINELCQRCAAKSKSFIVFPMCCCSLEETREWCDKFVNYGLQERHIMEN